MDAHPRGGAAAGLLAAPAGRPDAGAGAAGGPPAPGGDELSRPLNALPAPPALARRAQAFSRRHGVTLYVTLLAAYQALLHRYTGATDFAVGGGVANRNDRAAEQVIG